MKIAVLAALRFYKSAVSPLLPPACRYTPTCSEYAIEAVDRHGVLRGSLLGIACGLMRRRRWRISSRE